MAQRLQQLASKAKQALDPMYRAARTETVKQYETMMKNNAEYVVKDDAAADKLAKQWFFTKMSKVPAGIEHSQKEMGELRGKLGHWTDLSAQEMGTYLAFAAELYAWFSIGEILGRGGSITGYDI
jgi:F-type H+-transporting ATPase subunit g